MLVPLSVYRPITSFERGEGLSIGMALFPGFVPTLDREVSSLDSCLDSGREGRSRQLLAGSELDTIDRNRMGTGILNYEHKPSKIENGPKGAEFPDNFKDDTHLL